MNLDQEEEDIMRFYGWMRMKNGKWHHPMFGEVDREVALKIATKYLISGNEEEGEDQ